jgi:dihydropteroate synthase
VTVLDCAGKALDLATPRIMGILNVTPDSFSDGGRFLDPSRAVEQALAMVEAGADIIDIGGESTRPGARPVEAAAELDRILPVLEALAPELAVPVSVDTSKPEVMTAAAAAGAGMLNDVYALRLPGGLEAAVATGLPVCIMHMQGEPRTMQASPHYDDVVAQVRDFLVRRAEDCMAAGLARDRIVIDPGFGFGKTLAHNMTLLAELEQLVATGFPVLVGLSRKSSIGALTGAPVDEREAGSVAAALLAAERGANILRVHDVGATAQALKVLTAVMERSQ